MPLHYSADIITDSINYVQDRLTTVLLTFPSDMVLPVTDIPTLTYRDSFKAQVLLTGNSFDSFFNIMCDEISPKSFQYLGWLFADRYTLNEPVTRSEHLPFIDQVDIDDIESYCNPTGNQLITRAGDVIEIVSIARCARMGPLTRDGEEVIIGEDVATYQKLLDQQLFSSFEHIARATPGATNKYYKGWVSSRESKRLDLKYKFDYKLRKAKRAGWIDEFISLRRGD